MKRLSRFYLLYTAISCTCLFDGRADSSFTSKQKNTLSESQLVHRILVQDSVGRHAKDGRVYSVDGDSGRRIGQVQAAYNANVVQDPAGKYFYIGETVWARGNRGTREDLLPTYDAQSLTLINDLVLPGRGLTTPKKNNLTISDDGKSVYVFDMAPTNRVHVVDTVTHTIRRSIDIPGCSLTYPWGNSGFASLCADGSLVSVDTSKPRGLPYHTQAFFSPENDAVFEHSPVQRGTGDAWFISYSGIVYPVHLADQPVFGHSWSLQVAAGLPKATDATDSEQIAWRPGGWQLAALHYKTNHLFVLMHKARFWTHKMSGTEIWEFDVKSQKRVRRIKLKHEASLVGITQDARPLLFTNDDNGDLYIWDAKTTNLLRVIKHLGDELILTSTSGE